jgi:hypothetical protein
MAVIGLVLPFLVQALVSCDCDQYTVIEFQQNDQ